MLVDTMLTSMLKSPTVKEAGRLGGLRRAENLSPEQRTEIARKAGKARWGKHDKKEKHRGKNLGKGCETNMKEQYAIEWEELLQLIRQFVQSPLVKGMTIEHNVAARATGMTPPDHVDIDMFVYYWNEAPSSEIQQDIARGFIGDNGPRKVWDGLNVSNAWKDPTVRLYNCRLFWPIEKDNISQADEFRKIGFKSRSTCFGASYDFSKDGKEQQCETQ